MKLLTTSAFTFIFYLSETSARPAAAREDHGHHNHQLCCHYKDTTFQPEGYSKGNIKLLHTYLVRAEFIKKIL